MFKNEWGVQKSLKTFRNQTKGTRSIIKAGTGDAGEAKLTGEGEQSVVHVRLETLSRETSDLRKERLIWDHLRKNSRVAWNRCSPRMHIWREPAVFI